MALQNTMDTESVARSLATWLPGVLSATGGVEVSDVTMPTASGMSSETVLFTASWTGEDGVDRTQGLVLRVPPENGGIFNDNDIAREARVMSVVGTNTAAPVPAVLAHEETGDVLGSPFLLLEQVYGKVPEDDPPFVTEGWVLDLTPAQRSTMFDEALKTVAAVQTLDPITAGLDDLRHSEFPGTSIEQEFEYWKRFYAWAAAGRSSPTIDKAIEILEADRPTRDGPLVVSWGDARFGNLMFGPDQEVTGVLDWEMATLGPPEADLGYFLFFDRMYSSGLGVPRLEGFPDRTTAVARFEELTGHQVQDLDWFEAWAALRGAILIVRVGTMMIDHGFLPSDSAMPFNNPAAKTLASLLGLPEPGGESGWITGHRS